MEKMQEFLTDKKERISKRSLKYGMRELSIGFISYFLGCIIFMAPDQIHAQVETSKEPVAIAMEEKVSKEAEAPIEKKVQAAPASVEASLAGEGAQEGPKTEGLVEEKSQDEARIGTVAKLVVKDAEEPAAPAEGSLVPEKNIVALKLAKLADPEAQKAGESIQAKDIPNNTIDPRVSIRTENTTIPKILDAGLGEQLTWGVSFITPEGTKEGDILTIKLSDNMSLRGIEPDTGYALPVKFGDKIIVNAKRTDKQTIQYAFTKRINGLKYARIYIVSSYLLHTSPSPQDESEATR